MSIHRLPNGRYRARYRDASGKEWSRNFKLARDADRWVRDSLQSRDQGTWVSPRYTKVTVESWCKEWLKGYRTRKASTVRQAEVHVAQIIEAFGTKPLQALRPSDIRNWTAGLKAQGYADSYVYALHARLRQILEDAVHDGLIARSPVSRRTSPKQGDQRPDFATTEQVWALYDAMGERWGLAVLLAAFAGLRLSEVCGLRVADVDFMRGVITPEVQYPAEPLKTKTSRTPIPIPQSMAAMLAAQLLPGQEWLLTTEWGLQATPPQLQRRFRSAREQVAGLPEGFRFHDLRHYYASLLIESGLNVKAVQARMRHKSARTTLDTYGHLWPDADDGTRAVINSVMTARAVQGAADLRPIGVS